MSLYRRRRWFPSLFHSAGGSRPPRRARLAVERLEERDLLSAAIAGTVFNDLGGSGARQPGDPGVAGQAVFLDLNHDGQLDSTTTPVSPTSLAISNSGPGDFGTFLSTVGAFGAPLQVQGLPAAFQDVAVNFDLVNNSPDAIPVKLASPLGEQIPNAPLLFTIQPGQEFQGTFDGSSANPVTLTSGYPNNVVPNGTYAPQQAFTGPQYGIDNSGSNGTWGLVFFGAPGDFTGGPGSTLTIKSWSLSFTTAEPSTQTDAAGNYSFTGLAAGPYQVGLVHSAADVVTRQPANPVTVAAGQTLAGVDFGLRPGPDLTAASFGLAAPATAWGQQVTVHYVLTNRGAGSAPAFDVGLYLSADGVIGTSGPLLDSIHVPGGLAAGASVAGSDTVTLPGAPPPGFGPLSSSYVGLVIDPTGSILETQANQSNQGAGIDLAVLGPNVNTAVAAGPGTQQDPSLAVDPGDPQHLVTAYLDYSLPHTGYAGIGVAVSSDGGQTWTNSSISLPAGFDQGAASPTVAFDGSGNVYVSFMAATFLGLQPDLTNPDARQRADGFTSNNGIFVAKSTDGGHSWGTPVAVTENSFSGTAVPFEAFPDLAIDTIAGSPFFGRLYVTWSRFYPAGQFPNDPGSASGSDVMFALSTDGGATWATQMQNLPPSYYDNPVASGAGAGLVTALKDPNKGNDDTGAAGRGLEQFSTVSVGAGGAVYVASYAAGLFAVYASTDGGASTGTPGHMVSGFTQPNFLAQLGYPFFGAGNQVLTDPALTSYPNPDLNAAAPVTDNFRTLPLRQVAADPTRPGVVYALAASALDQSRALGRQGLDAGGIVLAVSTDFGQTWTSNYTVGNESESALLASVPVGSLGSWVPVLNDENGGNYGGFVPSGRGQVDAGQALPVLTVNSQGDVVVIWYDTRSDPAGQDLEVWGTVSADGGRHFSGNFPVSNQAFNPSAGSIPAPPGGTNFYLGDQIGLAATATTAYAAWTDTRNGSQDVYFSSFALTPAPAAPADRFAPNNTPPTATDLGLVTAQEVFPRLTLPPGNGDEWFRFQAGATAPVSVSVTAGAGSSLRLEVTDGGGNVLTPTGETPVLDSSGAVVGEELEFAATSGTTYRIHVSSAGLTASAYTLAVGALTADLGTQVEGSRTDSVATGGQDVYRLATAVRGSLAVTLTAGGANGGNLNLTILGADGQAVLKADTAGVGPGRTETLTVPVGQGQVVFLRVSGASLTSASGAFTLQFTNFDQYETASNGVTNPFGYTTLFLPTVGDPASLAAADLGGHGLDSLVTTNTDAADTVSVLGPNGDGTFQAPRQLAVGSGLSGALSAGDREAAAADVNGDGKPDVIMPNFNAGTVSVLLNNGDGTFGPPRAFAALPNPVAVVAGAFTGSGHTDLVVLQNSPPGGGLSSFALLKGDGAGSFAAPVLYQTGFAGGADALLAGNFSGRGLLDLIVFSKNESAAELFLNNGAGGFNPTPTLINLGEPPQNALALDLNGDGLPDLVTTGTSTGDVYVQLNNGNGTFSAPQAFSALKPQPGGGVGLQGLAVADFTPAGVTPPAGMSFGTRSLVVTAAPQAGQGGAEVILLPELLDGHGNYAGFGAPVVLATVGTAGTVAAGDFTGGGSTDLAVGDKGGVTVIYGSPLTLQSPRPLGDSAHLLVSPAAIVPGFPSTSYTYTAPTVPGASAGNEILDLSALFQDTTGGGLTMQVTGGLQVLPQTQNSSSGDSFRVLAAPGSTLAIQVESNGGGYGVYTLGGDLLTSLTVNAASLALGTTTFGTAGTAAAFTAGGAGLTAPVVVTAPPGVELSTDGVTWSSSLTLSPGGGTLASTSIDVRLQAGAAVGSVSGLITVTSAGAVEQDVAVGGTVNALPVVPPVVPPSLGPAGPPITASVSGSRLYVQSTATGGVVLAPWLSFGNWRLASAAVVPGGGGLPDVVLTLRNKHHPKRTRVVRADGAALLALQAELARLPHGGVVLALPGSDGFLQFVVGTESGGRPAVDVFSGQTGQLLRQFTPWPARVQGMAQLGTSMDNGVLALVVRVPGRHFLLFDAATLLSRRPEVLS